MSVKLQSHSLQKKLGAVPASFIPSSMYSSPEWHKKWQEMEQNSNNQKSTILHAIIT